ncbi:MAG TPA: phosphatase PAP2 family protein [Gaiellaceae bacterium]|nr:phosphatase PAP2 family protein [Gaiellaceae bacterium]
MRRSRGDGARSFSAGRELALGVGAYALYLGVARAVLRRDGRRRARRNGERIVEVERRLHLDVEPAVQQALLRYPRLVQGLNLGYGLFNVTLTAGWLALQFRRRDQRFHRFRRTCLLTYAGAQPFFLLLPTAPPRTLDGFVDTMSEVSGLDLEHPQLVRFYNPVAAMPSLHVAFAVVTGAEIAARSDSRVVRMLARSYAPAVATVVAGTGNHYVLDAVAGAGLGAAARRFVGHDSDTGR